MSTVPHPVRSSMGSRSFPLAFVGAFFLTCLGAEWFADHWVGRVCTVACVGIALFGVWHFGSAESFKPSSAGDRWKAWAFVSAALLLALVFGPIIALCAGSWRGRWEFGVLNQSAQHWLLIKLPTVVAQQIALQLFIVPGLWASFGRPRLVALVATSMFAALHLPNPLLVGLTGIAGYGWIWLYLRFRQMAPIIASHFILAVALAAFGGEYVLNMRVGARCRELLPQSVRTNSEQIAVLAHAISGRVDSVLQSAGEIIVRGYADDLIHDTRATSFCIVDVDRRHLVRIELSESSSRSPSELRNGFELRVPLTSIGTQAAWELYAANANGWHSKLGPLRAFEPLEDVPHDRRIQLFPKRIDGRCEQFAQQAVGSQVSGWAIDLDDHTVPTRLAVHCDGRNWVVPLAAKQGRRDIASAVGTEHVPLCGFDVVIHGVRLDQVRRIAFFAVDQHEILHPLILTPKVSERMAQHWPRIELRKYR